MRARTRKPSYRKLLDAPQTLRLAGGTRLGATYIARTRAGRKLGPARARGTRTGSLVRDDDATARARAPTG